MRRRAGGPLPKAAWDHADFELLAGGRNNTAVRLLTDTADLWAIRAEVPDETVPGRVWTNEIVLGGEIGKRPSLSLRLIVSTAESDLMIEPHVSGPVLQIANAPGLMRGGRTLAATPITLRTENDAQDLCDHLEDPERRLPVLVVSLAEGDDARPLIDDLGVAKALTGIARVVRIPADLTGVLTKRFGKFRSVDDGAVRLYLPGFSSADDPYRHRLFLAMTLQDETNATSCALWLRRAAADVSVSSLPFARRRAACRPTCLPNNRAKMPQPQNHLFRRNGRSSRIGWRAPTPIGLC